MTAVRSSCSLPGRATASVRSSSCAGPTPGSARFMSSTPAAEARAQSRGSPVTTCIRASVRTGDSIVFERSTGGQLTSPLWSVDPGHLSDSPSRAARRVRLTDEGRNPHFGASGGASTTPKTRSRRRKASRRTSSSASTLNGKDRRVHARSNYATRMEVSPSGEWLAFRENFHIYVVPMPPGGQVDLSLADEVAARAPRDRYRRRLSRTGSTATR